MTTKPFTTRGQIVAVTLDNNGKELAVSVCMNPDNISEAILEASNGDTLIVKWERITFCRDYKPFELNRLNKGDNVQGREVLKVKNFPHDHHLQLVLCKWKEFRFVVWQYNIESEGFNFGYYYTSIEDAEEKFKERMEYYDIK
jgi:hypothetical protein